MKWKVCFWHSYEKSLVDKIRPLCGEYDAENGCLWYEGTLDKFFEFYKNPILVQEDRIWITQYNRFDQQR